ncbi:Universal stress protein A-like protein [Linum perenne]
MGEVSIPMEGKAKMEGKPIQIMLAVNESNILKSQPHGGYIPASISCRFAFEWTLRKIIRSNTDDFKIIFITVVVSRHQGSPLVIPARKEPSTAEHARAMLLLEYFINRSTELGIACDYLIGKGDPEEVICREAKRTRPDLVVLGCRGLDRFMSIFLPSVSAYVRRNCNCPMVAIKRRAAITPRNPVND